MEDNYNEKNNYNENEYNEENNYDNQKKGFWGEKIDQKKEELKRKAVIKVLTILGPIGILIVLILLPILFVAALLGAGDMAQDILGYNGSYNGVSSDSYWWPIGSNETETAGGKLFASGDPALKIENISSPFSASRTLGGVTKPHYGIDIAGLGQVGVFNVIASKDGVVYAVNKSCSDQGGLSNNCGGQLGNYVIIKNSDGSYTKYGHMASGSVTVSQNETVKQGQVIGKVGNSGRSTGAHLHFQLEIGGLGSSYAVDPMTYFENGNYRPIGGASSSIIEMLHSWEGSGPQDDNYYYVYDDGYGTLTVGYGVTLKNHASRFETRGVDVSRLSDGSPVSKAIVDDIEAEILTEMRNGIVQMLDNNDIDLLDYQIDALLMRRYNVGNVNSFPQNYKLYGDTQELYDNYMKNPVKSNGKYSTGLVRRREAEWNLFHNGIYQLN